ncbi:MAG: chemotaxis protein CheW [Candidatus Obscuribacterales bacterium]|nr:chemotaxis protein CheW [Steroidobacteraceae bacterium]
MAAMMKAVAALTRQFELPPAAKSSALREQRWRGLRIGNLGLLVAHDSGGELLEEARIYPLPSTPAWCRGLINLRGQLIPAFDLHECFNLTRLRPLRQWWLILGKDADALAIAIDALPQSLLVHEAAIIRPEAIPDDLRAYVGQAYRVAEELWLEFRHRDFFLSLAGSRAIN